MSLSRRKVLLGSAGLALAGCGGTESPLNPQNIRRVQPTLTLHWAPRRRSLDVPSTANFAEITVRSVPFPEESATLSVRRERFTALNDEALIQTVALSPLVPVGLVELTVNFYDESGSVGSERKTALVAQAQVQVELKAPAGILPDIAVTGRVAHVAMLSNQVVPLGGRKELGFVVTDTDGRLLALTQESAFFEIVEGSGTILSYEATPLSLYFSPVPGSFQGLALGTARVRVRVADKVSEPTMVTVVPFAPIATGGRIAYLEASELLWDPNRRRIWFLDGATGKLLQSFDPATGIMDSRQVRFITRVSKLALSSDGSAVYGFSTGGGGVIRRVTLDDGVEQAALNLSIQPYSLQVAPYAPLPGVGNSVIVAAAPLGGVTDVVVYNGTVPRPVTLKTLLRAEGFPGTLIFPTPTGEEELTIGRLSVNEEGTVAYVDLFGFGTYRVGIGSQGLVAGTLKPFPFGRYYHGQLIDVSQSVYDALTGKLLGRLPALAAPSGLGRTYLVGQEYPAALRVLSQDDFTEQGNLALPTRIPLPPNYESVEQAHHFPFGKMPQVICWGNNGVAFQGFTLTGQNYLLLFENVPGL